MYTLRTTLLIAILLAVVALPLQAADDASAAAVAAFTQSFAGGDEAAKRAALPAVIALGRDADDTVYRLLVQAVGDPQTHDVAVPALRARSGLSPTFFDHGPGYPGYPQSDATADWNAWLASRTQDKEKERTLADLSRRLAALSTAAATTTAVPAPGSGPPAEASEHQHAPSATAPPGDLGRLSRIIFTDGATVVGHILSRHKDADGTVIAVEFIHRDGGGREVIPIDRIARIEDDAP